MRVVVGLPPLFGEIDAAFDVRGKAIIFAWGDTIFDPNGGGVPPELLAHEAVHGERQGTGDGRVYKVGFVVHDKAGNATYGECKFVVPHDQNKPAVDSGVKLKVCEK